MFANMKSKLLPAIDDSKLSKKGVIVKNEN